MADLFVSCGGVDRLLKLSQASAFTGFTSLCTLIIRHILEDEQTLTITFSHVSIISNIHHYSYDQERLHPRCG